MHLDTNIEATELISFSAIERIQYSNDIHIRGYLNSLIGCYVIVI